MSKKTFGHHNCLPVREMIRFQGIKRTELACKKSWRGKVKFDDDWEELMRNYSISSGYSYVDVREMMRCYFEMMREELMRSELVSFSIPFLGNIDPSISALRKHIRRKEEDRQLYMEIGGYEDEVEVLTESIDELTETYHRLLGESDFRKELHRMKMNGDYVRESKKALPKGTFDKYIAKRLTRITVSEARALRLQEEE